MFEDNNRTAKYDKFNYHTMIHEIRLASRLGWRVLCKSLVYAENVNTISRFLSHEYDTYISQSFSAGLQNCQSLNEIKTIVSSSTSCFNVMIG